MWKRPLRKRRRRIITSATIEATTRARAPRMTPTTIAVIWELLPGTLPPSPVSVGARVPVPELCEPVPVVADTTPDCDVGLGTKVLIGGEDDEGGVKVEGQVPVDESYTAIGAGAGPLPPYPVVCFQRPYVRASRQNTHRMQT